MSYDVFLAEFFKKAVKDLKKKYPSVNDDLKIALRVVCNAPEVGRSFHGFGNVKKIRARNSDVSKGKSGGYRLLYFLDHARMKIYPLLLYGKSQKEDITVRELKALLKKLEQEVG